MKILVVGLVNNVQLERLREEAKKFDHTVTGCFSKDIVIMAEGSDFTAYAGGAQLGEYDLIYFWTLGDKRWEWYTAGQHVNKKYGTLIVNKSTITNGFKYAPTPTLTYLLQHENNLPYPATAVVFTAKSYDVIKHKFTYPVIVKESMLHQGKGVYKADSENELKAILDSKKVPYPFVVREFIPNDGDIRIFTIGYKAVAAMKRVPKPGEYRSNISLGGTGEVFDLSKNSEIKELAETASKVTGIEIAGVDIILDKESKKPYILEVNDGPQFMGIEKYTGTNIAAAMVEYFTKLYAGR